MTPPSLPAHLVGVLSVRVNSAGVLVDDGRAYVGGEAPPPAPGPSVTLSSRSPRSRRGRRAQGRHDSRVTAVVAASEVEWADPESGEFRAPLGATRLLGLVPARRGVRVGWLIAWTILSALLALAWSQWSGSVLRHLTTASVLITLLVLWATAQEVKDRRRSRAGERTLPTAVAQHYPGLPIYDSLDEARSHYPLATPDEVGELARQLGPTRQVRR